MRRFLETLFFAALVGAALSFFQEQAATDAAVRTAFWCGVAETANHLAPGSVTGDIRRVCAGPRETAEADRFWKENP